MTLDPTTLNRKLDLLESIERASLRMVTQAIYDYRENASHIFQEEVDLVKDIGEDISREALDRLGASTIPVRLYGNIDYKKALYLFHPEFSVRQALFVDSKAEKLEGARTATIQMSQTSMLVRQIRKGQPVEEQGTVPTIIERDGQSFLVTTVFIKYNYEESPNGQKTLNHVSVLCLPNGMLQDRYNPTAKEGFWRAGRNAPSRGESFRVRISLNDLSEKAPWRVQRISPAPNAPYIWNS